MGKLLEILKEGPKIPGEDKMIWKDSSDESFSVKTIQFRAYCYPHSSDVINYLLSVGWTYAFFHLVEFKHTGKCICATEVP